eukprot:11981717-Ditylum_brightwellii.AAC.1
MEDKSTKETNEIPTPARGTVKVLPQTSELGASSVDNSNKSVSKEMLLQRRISARTRARAEKGKEKEEASFDVELCGVGEKHQD